MVMIILSILVPMDTTTKMASAILWRLRRRYYYYDAPGYYNGYWWGNRGIDMVDIMAVTVSMADMVFMAVAGTAGGHGGRPLIEQPIRDGMLRKSQLIPHMPT